MARARKTSPPPAPAPTPDALPIASRAVAELVREPEAARSVVVREPEAAPAVVACDDPEPVPAVVESPVPLRVRAAAREGLVELLTFRVGRELFAFELRAVEEAVDEAELRVVPDAPGSMLGVFSLRASAVPVYSPRKPLGVALSSTQAATLIVRSGSARIALAVDEVDDVLTANLAMLRPAPGVEDADGVLLGVVWRGRQLVSVLDIDAVVHACLSATAGEAA